MNQRPEPATPRPSATILLMRDIPDFEVLMVKRHHQIDFASGALVFPGGKIDPSDSHPAWSELCFGLDSISPEEAVLRIAAIREAYEEAGILLARDQGGALWSGNPLAIEARDAVAKGQKPFLDLVMALDVRLDLLALTQFARWITPVMMPKRFDTHFYLAAAPADQLAVCDGHETVDAEWVRPGDALDLAASGQRTIIFPTRMNLKMLAESENSQAAVDASLVRPRVVVTPWVEKRDHGPVLVIPSDAGYGAIEEDLESTGT